MSVHVALDGFLELASALPMPTARLRLPQATAIENATTALTETWSAGRKAYKRQIALGRSSMLRHVALMRKELEQAVKEEGRSVVGEAVLREIPHLRAMVANGISVLRAQLEPDDETRASFEMIDRLAPAMRGITRKIILEHKAAGAQQINDLVDFDNRLYLLELDFDPAANTPNPPSYDNANDLIRDLRALADEA